MPRHLATTSRTPSRWSIADDLTPGRAVTVTTEEVAPVLVGWFPGAPPEVLDAVDHLADALATGRDVGDLPDFLSITVTVA